METGDGCFVSPKPVLNEPLSNFLNIRDLQCRALAVAGAGRLQSKRSPALSTAASPIEAAHRLAGYVGEPGALDARARLGRRVSLCDPLLPVNNHVAVDVT
jgi:hypothetical protein